MNCRFLHSVFKIFGDVNKHFFFLFSLSPKCRKRSIFISTESDNIVINSGCHLRRLANFSGLLLLLSLLRKSDFLKIESVRWPSSGKQQTE